MRQFALKAWGLFWGVISLQMIDGRQKKLNLSALFLLMGCSWAYIGYYKLGNDRVSTVEIWAFQWISASLLACVFVYGERRYGPNSSKTLDPKSDGSDVLQERS